MLRAALEKAEADLARERQQSALARLHIQDLELGLQEASAERETLNIKITALSAENTDVGAQLAALEERYNTRTQNIEHEYHLLQQRHRELEQQYRLLIDGNPAIIDQTHHTAMLGSTLVHPSQLLSFIRNDPEIAAMDLDQAAAAELAHLRGLSADYAERLWRDQTELANLRSQIEALAADLARSRAEASKLLAEKDAICNNMDVLFEENTKLSEYIQAIEQEKRDILESKAAQIADRDRMIDALKTALNELPAELAQAALQNSEMLYRQEAGTSAVHPPTEPPSIFSTLGVPPAGAASTLLSTRAALQKANEYLATEPVVPLEAQPSINEYVQGDEPQRVGIKVGPKQLERRVRLDVSDISSSAEATSSEPAPLLTSQIDAGLSLGAQRSQITAGQRIEQLTQERNGFLQELETLRTEYCVLRNRNEQLEKELHELKNALSIATPERRVAYSHDNQSEPATATGTLMPTLRGTESLRMDDLFNSPEQLTTHSNVISNLISSKLTIEDKRVARHDEVLVLREECSQYRSRLQNNERELEQVREELAGANERIEELEAELARLWKLSNDKDLRIETLVADNTSLAAELARLTETTTLQKTAYDGIDKQLRTIAESQGVTGDDIRSIVETLGAEILQRRQEVEEYRELIFAMEDAKKQVEHERDLLTAEVERLQGQGPATILAPVDTLVEASCQTEELTYDMVDFVCQCTLSLEHTSKPISPRQEYASIACQHTAPANRSYGQQMSDILEEDLLYADLSAQTESPMLEPPPVTVSMQVQTLDQALVQIQTQTSSPSLQDRSVVMDALGERSVGLGTSQALSKSIREVHEVQDPQKIQSLQEQVNALQAANNILQAELEALRTQKILVDRSVSEMPWLETDRPIPSVDRSVLCNQCSKITFETAETQTMDDAHTNFVTSGFVQTDVPLTASSPIHVVVDTTTTDRLESQLALVQAQMNQQKRQVDDLQADLLSREARIEHLTGRLHTIESKNADLTQLCSQREAMVEKLQKELLAAQTQVQTQAPIYSATIMRPVDPEGPNPPDRSSGLTVKQLEQSLAGSVILRNIQAIGGPRQRVHFAPEVPSLSSTDLGLTDSEGHGRDGRHPAAQLEILCTQLVHILNAVLRLSADLQVDARPLTTYPLQPTHESTTGLAALIEEHTRRMEERISEYKRMEAAQQQRQHPQLSPQPRPIIQICDADLTAIQHELEAAIREEHANRELAQEIRRGQTEGAATVYARMIDLTQSLQKATHGETTDIGHAMAELLHQITILGTKLDDANSKTEQQRDRVIQEFAGYAGLGPRVTEDEFKAFLIQIRAGSATTLERVRGYVEALRREINLEDVELAGLRQSMISHMAEFTEAASEVSGQFSTSLPSASVTRASDFSVPPTTATPSVTQGIPVAELEQRIAELEQELTGRQIELENVRHHASTLEARVHTLEQLTTVNMHPDTPEPILDEQEPRRPEKTGAIELERAYMSEQLVVAEKDGERLAELHRSAMRQLRDVQAELEEARAQNARLRTQLQEQGLQKAQVEAAEASRDALGQQVVYLRGMLMEILERLEQRGTGLGRMEGEDVNLSDRAKDAERLLACAEEADKWRAKYLEAEEQRKAMRARARQEKEARLATEKQCRHLERRYDQLHAKFEDGRTDLARMKIAMARYVDAVQTELRRLEAYNAQILGKQGSSP
ncbi:Coiled-coil protein [Giardia muris]|uniref:Coiled-coil protein n=1 Tax=Giardia muris TaxID=5742 RepID=A0A4Z1TA51_GIAMU|nr:Coiled-coil protein [Giardia muris]|eukprot:TNJ29379.1 Coiled-coil protein [Giardia muris]